MHEIYTMMTIIIIVLSMIVKYLVEDNNEKKEKIEKQRADIDKFFSIVDYYEIEIEKFKRKANNNNNTTNSFTQEELKKIRFVIHPDKNKGKNQELFIKINELIK